MTAQTKLTERWGQVLSNTYGTPPVAIVSGKGATVTDEDGKDYLSLIHI